MTCGCNGSFKPDRRPVASAPRRGLPKGAVKFCDVCDSCNENISNVKICAFVVPTLDEGRYYKNSFVFVEEEDSVYYITEERGEIPFGTRPIFADDYDPLTAPSRRNNVVYDMKNSIAYVYGPDKRYKTFALADPAGAVEK